jgi:hypothetical protein
MKTMQMQSVETSAGTAICCEPSRIACLISVSWPSSRMQFMFSISTVASSTSMPTARARPSSRHDVDRFVKKTQDEDGGQNGQRNRDGDDDGAPLTAYKEQNH